MGTVTKALSLLTYFSRDRQEIGLTEMTRLSGMNKATVYRLLSELQGEGFVEQIGSGREYRLGPVYLRLAALRETAVPMREVAQDVLRRLSEITGETAHMSLLQGGLLSVVNFAYSAAHGTRVTMEDADVISLHATSSGLAVLAYADADFTETELAKPLQAITPKTVTEPAQLRQMLKTVRQRGFAESVSGYEQDVHSHGCPIFDARMTCIGAIAVATPVARITDELRQIIQSEVRDAALELTRLMGGFAPEDFKNKMPANAAST